MRAALAAVAAVLCVRLAAAEPKLVATHSLGGTEHALARPLSGVWDGARGEFWASGSGATGGALVIIDAATLKTVGSVPVPSGSPVSIDPARGRIYAPTFGKLHVIDPAKRAVTAIYGMGSCNPRASAADPVSGRIAVFCDLWDPVLAKTRQELNLWSADGAQLAKVAFSTSAYLSSGTGMRVHAGRVYLPLVRSASPTSAQQGQLWVFSAANLALAQTLAVGLNPTGVAVDADGTVFLGDYSYSKVHVLSPGADGTLSVSTAVPNVPTPWALDLDPKTRKLYALNYYGGQAVVIDAPGRKVLKGIGVGSYPIALAVDSAGGRAFVVNSQSIDVSVLDLGLDAALAKIDIRARGASDIALDPEGKRAFVTSGLPSGGVNTIDRATGQLGAFYPSFYDTPQAAVYLAAAGKLFYQVPGGVRRLTVATSQVASPYALTYAVGLAAVEGSGRLLVSRSVPGAVGTTLTVFDAERESVLREVALGPSTASARSAGHNPFTGKAYVPLSAANAVAVVDVENGALLKKVPVGLRPEAVAVDPVLNRVFVANAGANSVSVIDGAADAVIATLAAGTSPQSAAFKRRGGRVYVGNAGSGTVSVFDSAKLALVATVPVGGNPAGVRVDQDEQRVYVPLKAAAKVAVISDLHLPDSQPPSVTHAPVAGPVAENETVTVSADVTDDRGVALVALTFWDAAGGAYETVPMKLAQGSTYRAQIPGQFLTALRGTHVAYLIDATDDEGNGPPTGAVPGTLAAPNRFEVKKSLVRAWSYEFGRVCGGYYRMTPGPSAAVGDMKPDRAGLEVATGNEEYYPLGTGTGMPMGRWFLFDAKGETVFWKNTQNDEAHSSVALHDLDGDGAPEMFGGTTSGNQVQAFDSSAAWRWRYSLGSHHLATPAVDAASAGAPPTVFSASFDSYFRAIDAKTGQLQWTFKAPSQIWSSPAIADVDGDGKKEAAFGSNTGMLQVLDTATKALKWQAAVGGPTNLPVRASPAVADVDGDGTREVLVGAPTGLFHSFDGRTGAPKWTFKTGAEIVSSAAVGDLDGDGKPEVVFGSGDGFLYALTGGGALKWKAALGSPVYSSPALARRSPGAVLDVYITTLDGRLLVVRGSDGTLLAGFGAGAAVVSSPIVADVDGDGRLEVFFQDRKADLNSEMKGDVFWAVRDLGSSVAPFSREWPQFRHDAAHTGVYGGAAYAAKPMDFPPAAVAGLAVSAPPEGGRLALSWTASAEADLAFYRVYRDGQFLAQAGAAAAVDIGLTNGTTYAYQVSAVDAAGQEGAKSAVVTGVPMDRVPPVSRIVQPAGQAYRSNTVAVSGTAADVGTGLAEVKLHVIDQTEGGAAVYIASGTSAWSFALTAAQLKNGHAYLLRSQALDKAGNLEPAVSSTTFIYDSEPPAATLSLCEGKAWVSSAATAARWTLTDSAGGLGSGALMRFSAGGAPWSEPEPFSASKPWDLGATEGIKTLQGQVSDAAGNWSAPVSASCGLDLKAPAVTVLKPAPGQEIAGALSASGAASDAASGIASVSIRVTAPGQTLLEWTVLSGTASWSWDGTLPLKRAVAYAVRARAVDGVGRTAEEEVAFSRAGLSAAAGLKLEAPPEGGELRLSWAPNPEPDVASYRVYPDDKPAVSAATVSYVHGGLLDGTTYSYRVSAVDGTGVEGPKSDAVSGVPRDTLAPLSKIVVPVSGTRIPVTTVAVAGTAADSGVAGLAGVEVGFAEAGSASFSWSAASGVATFTAQIAGLKDGATYRLASRAKDAEGNVEKEPAESELIVDLPPPAVTGLAAALAATGEAATLGWNAVPVPDLAGYKVYGPDGEFVDAAASTTFALSGLSAGTEYTYAVAAVDTAGQEGPKTSVAFKTYASGKARAWIRVPADGKRIWGNAVTIVADTEGVPSKVVFQFRHENHSGWSDVSTPDAKPPYSVYWNVSDAKVSTGTHRLRAVAYDDQGLPELKPAEITVILDDANADLVEDGNPEVDPNVVHRKSEKLIVKDTAVEVALADGTSVIIPPGAVPDGETLAVKVVPPAQAPKPVSKKLALTPAGVFREFTFAGGTTEFKKDLLLSLPVPDEDGDGKVDGTDTPVSSLKVYYFSEKDGVWLPVTSKAGGVPASADGAPAVSASGNSATFPIDHFTLFGLFAENTVQARAALGEVYAFPNPARAGKSPTFHVEAGRAQRMELRVWDLAGQLVYSASVESPPNVVDGRFAYRHRWEAASAASGVYLYIVDVTSPEGEKTTSSGKVALVR